MQWCTFRPGRGAATWLPAVVLALALSACSDRPLPLGPEAPTKAVALADTRPARPGALAATGVSASSIQLSWVDASDNETRFTVLRLVGTTWASVGQVPANATSFTDTGLAAATGYEYRVRACNSLCSWAASAAGTTLAADGGAGPRVVTGAATAVTPSGATLAGTVNPGGTETSAWFEYGTASDLAGAASTAQQGVGSGAADQPVSASVGGLQAATQYYYRLVAQSAAGTSRGSILSFVTGNPAVRPSAPTGLTATGVSTSQMDLRWTDNSSNETRFVVQRLLNGAWQTVATLAAGTTAFSHLGLGAGTTHTYRVRACNSVGCQASAQAAGTTLGAVVGDSVRVVLFGDSNTEFGYSGTNPSVLASSYVSGVAATRLRDTDPHSPYQLAGKVEAGLRAVTALPVRVVNHGIGGTSTGGGSGGGRDRNSLGAPNARALVGVSTRFEAEVLGRGYPWSGGEPTNTSFPDGPIVRTRAFAPDADDFAYISMGTNDPGYGLSATRTLANLEWMVDQWLASGRPASHLIVTTLAPHATFDLRAINDGIRAMQARKGFHLVDLTAFTSADNGLTWRSASLHVGDAVHYSEEVRDWLAARIVEHAASF